MARRLDALAAVRVATDPATIRAACSATSREAGATPAAIGPPETDEIGATAKDHAICLRTIALQRVRHGRQGSGSSAIFASAFGVLLGLFDGFCHVAVEVAAQLFEAPRPPFGRRLGISTASACRMRQIACLFVRDVAAGGFGAFPHELRADGANWLLALDAAFRSPRSESWRDRTRRPLSWRPGPAIATLGKRRNSPATTLATRRGPHHSAGQFGASRPICRCAPGGDNFRLLDFPIASRPRSGSSCLKANGDQVRDFPRLRRGRRAVKWSKAVGSVASVLTKREGC